MAEKFVTQETCASEAETEIAAPLIARGSAGGGSALSGGRSYDGSCGVSVGRGDARLSSKDVTVRWAPGFRANPATPLIRTSARPAVESLADSIVTLYITGTLGVPSSVSIDVVLRTIAAYRTTKNSSPRLPGRRLPLRPRVRCHRNPMVPIPSLARGLLRQWSPGSTVDGNGLKRPFHAELSQR